MRKARTALVASLFVLAVTFSASVTSFSQSESQNREKFVISARAGGVNAVTGRATMRAHGNSEWQLLTIKEDLETGDAVRTDRDGRVEMLLNPGSYMRVGENSEFELADNSLSNLEVRLVKGTAIVEVTGADDEELFIGITTPHARMSIVRRGLYRVSVVPGNTTELIVRKGRVMLEDSHTKVKGGNKVIFSNSTFSVAKLEKADKDDTEALNVWSKERAQTLAKANSRISGQTLSAFASRLGEGWSNPYRWGRSGLWFFNNDIGCYTLLPLRYGWGSPYGRSYSRFFGYWPGSNYGRPTFGAGGHPRPSGVDNGNRPVASQPAERTRMPSAQPMGQPRPTRSGDGDRPGARARVLQ
jgi:hypothetical protein